MYAYETSFGVTYSQNSTLWTRGVLSDNEAMIVYLSSLQVVSDPRTNEVKIAAKMNFGLENYRFIDGTAQSQYPGATNFQGYAGGLLTRQPGAVTLADGPTRLRPTLAGGPFAYLEVVSMRLDFSPIPAPESTPVLFLPGVLATRRRRAE